jgi:hypothetical protein
MAQTEQGRTTPAKRREALHRAAEVAGHAARTIRDGGEDVNGIAHAAGELLAVLARGYEGRAYGPLAEITDRYDRAARTPHRVLPQQIGPLARDPRRASRQIAAAGPMSGRGKEKFAMLALLLSLAGLVVEIAAWLQARARTHQAAPAHGTATALTGLVGQAAPAPRPHPPSPSRVPSVLRGQTAVARRDPASSPGLPTRGKARG